MVGTALPLSKSSIRALSRLIFSRRLPISLSFIRPKNADKDSDDGSESMELFLIVVQSGNYVSKSQSSTQYLGRWYFGIHDYFCPSEANLAKHYINRTYERPYQDQLSFFHSEFLKTLQVLPQGNQLRLLC